MEQGFSHIAGLAAFVGFLTAAIAFFIRGKRSWPNTIIALALFLTALWSLVVVLVNSEVLQWGRLPPTMAALRDGGWFAAIIGLMRQGQGTQSLWRRLSATAAILVLAEIGFALYDLNLDIGVGLRLNLAAIELSVSAMGLVLVENLVFNLSPQRLWSVKLLAIGLAALFGYNILLRIPEFLGEAAMAGFVAAQPLVYLIALPLIVVTGVRNNSLGLQVHSSRTVVFHSTTIICAGVVLQGTAIAAFYVRSFGGTPAIVLSIVIGFLGVLGIAIAISSRAIRSRIRVFINENFYSYKYDYRLEWTKFIQALSRHQERGAPERALRTLTDLLDSSGGLLCVRRHGWHQFVPLASWSFGDTFGPIDSDDRLLDSIRDETVAFLELGGTDETEECTYWRQRFPGTWLVVPLRLREELVGFALLRKSMVARRLDWEDRNLVSLIAMQLALYLVHEQITQELADSQQLAEFNDRVAFALHDVKNTIGQLNLVLHNAKRFGDDADFRADMMTTIHHAVDNLQKLMGRLKNELKAQNAPDLESRIDICAILARCAEKKMDFGVVFDRTDKPVYAAISKSEEFKGALEHVITNAVEASPSGSSVLLSVDQAEQRVCVRIKDQGPGMTSDFLANELFRPLHTTKKNGLGIGAYQARAIMRNLGGDMVVQSAPGQGTTVSLYLPACTEEGRGVAQ